MLEIAFVNILYKLFFQKKFLIKDIEIIFLVLWLVLIQQITNYGLLVSILINWLFNRKGMF